MSSTGITGSNVLQIIEQQRAALRAQGRGKALAMLSMPEVPYKWQIRAAQAWYATSKVIMTGANTGKIVKRGTIVAPTATGKTNLTFQLMAQEQVPTLVIGPTQAISDRWIKDLVSRGADVGCFDGRRKHEGQDVDIAVINTVNIHTELFQNYLFIVADEIHHWASEDYCKLLEYTQEKSMLGLTSTFERMDGRHKIIETGIIPSQLLDSTIQRGENFFSPYEIPMVHGEDFFGTQVSSLRACPVIFRYTLKEAAADGVIAPLNVTTKGVALQCCGRFPHADTCEWNIYNQVSTEISKTWASLGIRDIKDIKAAGFRGQKLWGLITKRKMLLSQAWNKAPVVLEIVMRERGQVLIFSESIDSIIKLRGYLEQNMITTGIYHSKNINQRDQDFEDWQNGKKQVLLSARALDEGMNVPEVKVGIIVASGRANRQWTQRIGRILRKTGKTAHLYIVYCRGSVEQDYPEQVRKIISGEM